LFQPKAGDSFPIRIGHPIAIDIQGNADGQRGTRVGNPRRTNKRASRPSSIQGGWIAAFGSDGKVAEQKWHWWA
jgi:hypothetical protein